MTSELVMTGLVFAGVGVTAALIWALGLGGGPRR